MSSLPQSYLRSVPMLDLSTYTDVSRYQNSRPGSSQLRAIDFKRMQDQGVTGVVIRKSIGVRHDPAFELNWHHAGMVEGLKRSVYCVPFVSYGMDRQIRAMQDWPSGGVFDGVCDIPAWDDVERRHKLTRSQAITRLLGYHYAMKIAFGEVEFYTAKYVWQDFYSKQPGWQADWGLVAASYRKDLYHFNIPQLKVMVAEQKIHPVVPTGWLKTREGNTLPSHLRWEQWQISADGNNLGEAYGVHSRDIDISFRQGELPDKQPPPADSKLIDLVVVLREAYGYVGDIIEKVEEEVSA